MYDPFAAPQVMPGPVPVPTPAAPPAQGPSPNNAFAGLLQRYPELAGLMHGGGGQFMDGFQQARSDWRSQRPQFSFDPNSAQTRMAQRQAFMPQMQDWRSQRPTFGSYLSGLGTAPTGVMTTNPNAGV